jgi:UPF0755 protein
MAHSNPYEAQGKGGAGCLVWTARLVLLFLAITSCTAASAVLLYQWRYGQQSSLIRVEGGAPHLNPVERVYLQAYLATRTEELDQPVGEGLALINFTINPGMGAAEIALALEELQLLRSRELFLNYLRFYGLDGRLAAGSYRIDPQWNVPELATALTRAVPQEIELRFLEGWRLEEMANYLAVTTPANIRADEFLTLAQRRGPLDLNRYPFLASLPAEATLEGFLFPDSYRVPIDADAQYLIAAMLTNFEQRVTPAMRQAYGAQGLTVFEAVILASIVEREAVVAAERPLMASVFLNRIGQGMRLDADPTIQYALGYQADSNSWWKSPLSQADLRIDSPYNTYLYTGLPPGPIANPGLASLQALAEPAQTNYLFFVLDCWATTPGTHNFSLTYEEHLQYVQRCR